MLLGPVRTHLTTWAGNTDCIAKINSRGEHCRAESRALASNENISEGGLPSIQDKIVISNEPVLSRVAQSLDKNISQV